MYERFTDRSRRCIILSQEIATKRGDNAIDVAHLLVAVAEEGEAVGAVALANLGFDKERALEDFGDVQAPVVAMIPMTAKLRKVFELSLREALQLGHSYVGTEHLLLAIVRDGDNDAARLLHRQDIELTAVKQEVMDILRLGGSKSETLTVTLELTRAQHEALRVFVAQYTNNFGPLASTHPLELIAKALRG